MSSPSSNVLTITDNSGTITSISYVPNSLVVTTGQSNSPPPTIQKSGNVFTITFNCDRKGSSSVADSFNTASGGSEQEYAAYGGGGTPNSLNFWFSLQIEISTQEGRGTAILNVGQGHSGTHNNWWLGGSIVDSSQPGLNIAISNTAYSLSLPVSGGVSDYTLSAGTTTGKFVNYDDLLYNQVRAKASHNSYKRTEGLSDQFAYWRIRSLELDLHVSSSLPRNWYVYHGGPDRKSSVSTFSDALQLLAGFHAAVPDHEVCTIALDLKDGFDPTHTPEDLDALIAAALPGCVYTPAQFLGSNSNLQQSANQWPKLSELRGKFVFIMTTGDLEKENSNLNQYVKNGETANIRTGFVAPEISTSNQITSKDYAVWFNMKIKNSPNLGPLVRSAGFMSRGYGGNSESEWNQGIVGQNHLVGTDEVNSLVDPWSRTDNTQGWPFEGINVDVDPDTREPGTVIGMRIISGDIWGKQDSCAMCVFASNGDGAWTWGVSVPGSHTPNDYGKAGLMARASSDPSAANFCVVRPAQNYPMRVQVRASQGASTQSWDLVPPANAGVTPESWMYMRLVLTNGACSAEAFGSFDGVNWISIHKQDFEQPLTLVGTVGSSHDTSQSIRYLWFPVGSSPVPNPQQLMPIGQKVQAKGFEGVYPFD